MPRRSLLYTAPDRPELNWDSPQAHGLWAIFAGARLVELITSAGVIWFGPTPGYAPGLGPGVRFNGGGDYLQSATALTLAPPYSLIFTVIPLSTTGMMAQQLLPGSVGNYFSVWGGFVRYSNAGVADYSFSTLAVAAGVPATIAFAFTNATTVTAYYNGVAETQTVTTPATPSAQVIDFGDRNFGSFSLNGFLLDVRFYPGQVLGPTQIWAQTDPATRFDMFSQKRRTYFVPAAGGGLPLFFQTGVKAGYLQQLSGGFQ